MYGRQTGTPPALVNNLKHNKVMHEMHYNPGPLRLYGGTQYCWSAAGSEVV